MFTIVAIVFIRSYNGIGETGMGAARQMVHKHFRLDAAKIKRAQRLLKADTETETIDRALDVAICEAEKNRITWEATERFIKSGIQIKDVYGRLAK